MTDKARSGRRQQILEALALELEQQPGSRITTARLAQAVGVSEAALYRHFPSKAKMFEGLISFAEEVVFGRVKRILKEQTDPGLQCRDILTLLLGFAERNPGISRILAGDALVGEHQRLQERVAQFFERIESHLKQILREAEQRRVRQLRGRPEDAAGLLMAVSEGRISAYVRSRFRRPPGHRWEEHWGLLETALFTD